MNQISKSSPKTKPGGRPRSEVTRRTILNTALELTKQETLQSITIEAIAKSAGVSKATIYRWWNSKASVVIDAFIEHHVIRTPMPRDIPPVQALVQHWRSLVEQYSGWPGRVVAQILAEGQSDPEVLREFRERFHYGRRAVVREVVEALFEEYPLKSRITAEELMDMYYAPIYMRLMWGHAPLGEEFRAQYPIDFFTALGVAIDAEGHPLNTAKPA